MRKAVVICALAISFSVASPVAGQGLSRIEIGGGFQDVAIRHEFEWANYVGWSVEEATFVRPRLAVPVVVDAAYWNWTAPSNAAIGQRNRRYGVLAGVRATGIPDRPVIPFAEILAGAARISTVLYGPPDAGFDYADATSVFAIQPGGGVELRVRRSWSITGAVDARILQPQHGFSWHWQLMEWRVRTGITYRFLN